MCIHLHFRQKIILATRIKLNQRLAIEKTKKENMIIIKYLSFWTSELGSHTRPEHGRAKHGMESGVFSQPLWQQRAADRFFEHSDLLWQKVAQ